MSRSNLSIREAKPMHYINRLIRSWTPLHTRPGVILTLLWFPLVSVAQFQPYYEYGKGVAPAYEGYQQNADGSYTMYFGYMNENWEEELSVPIGASNSFAPGPADRGQPTRFLPRRNRMVFGVEVPEDFGDRELVWTLITREGVTQKAYGSLRKDYVLEPITIQSESGTVSGGRENGPDVQNNVAPRVDLAGERIRRARVGQPLRLEVIVQDDGQPKTRRYRLAFDEDDTPRQRLAKALRPPIRGTVNRVVGLYFGWHIYRGDGEASFSPAQAKTWEDTRAFQNSPWSPYWEPPEAPSDGRWVSEVIFHEPGEYVLRGRADDGGLTSDIEVMVQVD